MTTPSIDLSVVVPCHNEEGNLKKLYCELREVLDTVKSLSYEVIVTDDFSTDGSWAVLKGLASHDSRIRIQKLRANRGESTASWAGMCAATGRYIMTIDADLQNDPHDIPRFLAGLESFDCVCGTRVDARSHGDSWLRRISSSIANSVRNRLTGEDISDAGCTYRAFRRECLRDIAPFNGMHRFLPTLIRMRGFRVTEIEVTNRPRASGSSHYGVWNRVFKTSADLLAVRWMKARMINYEISERVGFPEQVVR